jgi:hypothetical protein
MHVYDRIRVNSGNPRHAAGSWAALCLLGLGLLACGRQRTTEPAAASTVAPAGAAVAAGQASPQPVSAEPNNHAALGADAVAALRFTPPAADACALDVDPVRLRTELDMQGKKHFTELLGLLRVLAAWPADPALAAQARAAAHRVLDQYARGPTFHDLATADDDRFDEDSMSYLRGCWYAQELGWDTREWRAAIDVVVPRVIERLPRRGIDQRMSFTLIFAALGLAEAESVQALYAQGAVANHRPFAYWVASPQRAYELTHEIFGLTWRGRRRPPYRDPIDERYAKKAVYTLLHVHLTEKNHDPAAELVLNRVQLGDANDEQLNFARHFLAEGQNADGSFGFHTAVLIREQKGNPRYDVAIGGNLHTTLVSLWALMATCR